jgi:hypothetical protein
MMRRTLALLVFVFALCFSQGAMADSEATCGIDKSGNIIPGDPSICEEDIAFGMLHDMFPSIMADILPFVKLGEFSAVSGKHELGRVSGEYHGDRVAFVLFEFFYKLVLLCVSIYVGLMLLSALGRVLKGQPIGEKEQHRDNLKTWTIGGIAGGVFLIPFKNMYIGQLVIFSFAIGALAFANSFMSFFLAAQQNSLTSTFETERVESVSDGRFIDRHDYLADRHYRQLTEANLCLVETTGFVMTRFADTFTSTEQVEKTATCLAGEAETVNVMRTANFDENQPAGVTAILSSDKKRDGNRHFRELAGLSFMTQASRAPSCGDVVSPHPLPSVRCGSVEVHAPDWLKNPLVRVWGDYEGLNAHLYKLAYALDPSMSPAQIKEVLASSWKTLSNRLKEALKKAADLEIADGEDMVTVNNAITKKRAALEAALFDKNQTHFKNAALMLHQEANNVLAFGRITDLKVRLAPSYSGGYAGSVTPYGAPSMIPQERNADVVGAPHLKGLYYHLSRARELAMLVRTAQCQDQQYGLEAAEKVATALGENAFPLSGDAHFRCVDIDTRKVSGYTPEWRELAPDVLRDTARAAIQKQLKAYGEKWREYVGDYADTRRAVEASFQSVVEDMDGGNWWIDLRQRGYLAMADYAFMVNRKVNDYKKDIRLLTNHFTTGASYHDKHYISESVYASYNTDQYYPEYMTGAELMHSTAPLSKQVDGLVGRHHWLAAREQMMRTTTLNDDHFSFDEILVTMTDVFTPLSRMGISTIKNAKSMTECPTDPQKCPFPLTDPVIELTLMGHDMVEAGAGFASLVIGLRLASHTVQGMDKGVQSFIGSGGSLSDSMGKWMDRFGGASQIASETSKKLTGITDILFALFGKIVMLYIAIGAVLAYLLPAVPKIYIYMQYIAWLMVVVMSAFSIMLMTLYWLRYREKRDVIKQASSHYGVEMALKPLFSLISILFAWFFFYAVSFLTGITIGWVWALPIGQEGGGFLRALLDPLFFIMIIGVVYFVGLRYAYSLMDDLTGQLLSHLGVNNQKTNDKVSTFIKAVLYDQVMAKGEKFGGAFKARDKRRDALDQRFDNAARVMEKYNEKNR